MQESPTQENIIGRRIDFNNIRIHGALTLEDLTQATRP